VQERVVDHALVHRGQHAGAVPLIQGLRIIHFDADVINARRRLRLLGSGPNAQASNGEVARFQILDCVISRTGAQRTQQELGRRHPLIKAPILKGLVAEDRVAPGFDLKLDLAQVIHENF
jgi:hypothetical protein